MDDKITILSLSQKYPKYNFIKTSNIPTNCLSTLKFILSFNIAFVYHYKHFPVKNGLPFANLFKWSYSKGLILVELFFMLSGFGMFLGYGEKIIKRELTFKQYIMKRILKLYPLFFLTTILITILEIWHKHLTGKTFIYGNFDCWHFFMNLILCQDGIFGTEFSFNGPSWCISICFILYIIHFAIMYFSKEKINAIYSYIILAFIGLSIISMRWNYPFILNQMVGRGLSCFSIGVILANIYLISDKLNTTLIGYLSLIILTLYYLFYYTRYNLIIGNFRFVFIMIISPLIIFSCLYVSWINKFLSKKPMIFLGSLSINIFLLHFIVQCIIINIDLNFKIRLNYSLKKIWLLYCFSTIIVSFIYNKYVDKFIKFLLLSLVKIILNN
jgi:peptidoglycan/LPS O-acetylase OafA/YrhL